MYRSTFKTSQTQAHNYMRSHIERSYLSIEPCSSWYTATYDWNVHVSPVSFTSDNWKNPWMRYQAIIRIENISITSCVLWLFFRQSCSDYSFYVIRCIHGFSVFPKFLANGSFITNKKRNTDKSDNFLEPSILKPVLDGKVIFDFRFMHKFSEKFVIRLYLSNVLHCNVAIDLLQIL